MDYISLSDLKSSTDDFILATDVAGIVGINPQSIRLTAQKAPEKLGFPVCVCGTSVRIPRKGFIAWVEGGESK